MWWYYIMGDYFLQKICFVYCTQIEFMNFRITVCYTICSTKILRFPDRICIYAVLNVGRKFWGWLFYTINNSPRKIRIKKSFMAALHNVFPTVLYRMVGIGIAQAQKARKVIITKITRQLSRGNIFIFYSWKKSSTKISKSLITRGRYSVRRSNFLIFSVSSPVFHSICMAYFFKK